MGFTIHVCMRSETSDELFRRDTFGSAYDYYALLVDYLLFVRPILVQMLSKSTHNHVWEFSFII